MHEACLDAPKIAMKKASEKADIVANEFLKDCESVIPRDTGVLSKSGRIEIETNQSRIRIKNFWETPYARKVYYVTAKSGSLKWAEVNALKNKLKYGKMFKK